MTDTQGGPLYRQLSTMRTPPTGWQLVFAQTRTDETGLMTLPLTGYGFGEVASVLATHPGEVAALDLFDSQVPDAFGLTEAELAELVRIGFITEDEAAAARA